MTTNDEVRKILLEIVALGLLRIRSLGYSGLAAKCAQEADHLHNLPYLIGELSWEQFLYYYSVERVCFINQQGDNVSDFKPLWYKLEHIIDARNKEIEG
jgi:hypothetical protein